MPTSSESDAFLDVLVIGAGQAGLATGYQLQQAGLHFRLLEAAAQPGGAWPHYYKSLRLFSPARFSSLPGLPFPGDPKRYPTRDEVSSYLHTYAKHFRFPITTNAHVTELTQAGGIFTVATRDGQRFQARTVIVATGSFTNPVMPAFPGQEKFRGVMQHSAAYREPAPFRGQQVIVVGAGNSAVQIATELAKVAHVTLASRAPVNFIEQRPLGRDIHFWWWLFQFDTRALDSRIGRFTLRLAGQRSTPVLDAGTYRAALAANTPERRPLFSHFTENGVVWENGEAEAVDAVIFATGYRPSVAYLAALGALDADGLPLQRHGMSTTVPCLAFVGLERQRTLSSEALRGVGSDAAVVVHQLKQYLQQGAQRFETTPKHGLKAWLFARCCPSLA